jgi:WD40 repeat protein/DNA-binding phage protein
VNVPKKRQRGVIPTPQGLKKLQAAILEAEREDIFESRLTQEKISEHTGLARRTLRKVFNREGCVSLSTLTTLFSAFNLELESGDYTKLDLSEKEDVQTGKYGDAGTRGRGEKENIETLYVASGIREELSIQNPKSKTAAQNSVRAAQNQVDWGEAIDVSLFCGRQSELDKLEKWIIGDRCRLIALLGIGGIGKTALSVKIAERLQDKFDYIIWRSLRNAPPLETILGETIQFISNQQEDRGDFKSLLNYLRLHRCLLVLDNVEAILQPKQQAGQYRNGYEGYGELFKTIGETTHQSCLILTSREKPAEIALLEGLGLLVHSLTISGSAEAAQALLEAMELSGEQEQKQQLAQRYDNSPLAVKLVASSIQDLFNGEIAQFLAQDTTIFHNIRYLLEQQFARLSTLEQTIMYWLAINREWTSITELAEDIVPTISRVELLEALKSLSWRSLIEKQSGNYTQQPVVMEYVTERLLVCISDEIQGNLDEIKLLKSHALLKAQAKDYLRNTQIRLILEPFAQQVLKIFGTKKYLQTKFSQILSTLQQQSPPEPSYLAGNLLNLLCHLQIDLSNWDLSNLTIWQTDFRGRNLQGVNFKGANLAKSVFTKTFASVYALAFSPDNQLLATGHANGEIGLWQVATGQLLFCLKRHSSSVWTLAFSPDGETLASGSFDRAIALWKISTGVEQQMLSGHSDWVRGVAFSPDGMLLASCSNDGTIKLWECSTGRERQTLCGHTAQVTAICFHPQGHLLASGSEDRTLRLWEVETGKCLKILQGHNNIISSLAFNADGGMLASCEEQIIKLWNVDTGECTQTLQENLTFVWTVTFSPDGQLLAGSDGKTLRLWDVKTGKCSKILSGYTSQVWALAWSRDGQMLAGSDDEMVGLWDVKTGERLRTWQGYINSVGSYWSLAFSPDGQILASGSGDGTVRIWDVERGECLKTFCKHIKTVSAIAFSPNGQILASGGEDCAIWLWDLKTGIARQALLEHSKKVWSVAFNRDGQMLASGSADRTIKIWDLKTGSCLKTLLGHAGQVLSVTFSHDSQILASVSEDRTIKLWEIETGNCLATLTGHQGWIWTVAFSPDDRILASGSEDRTIKLWEIETGNCLATLSGHAKLIWAIAFGRDGKTLLSGSSDRTAKLWDLKTFQCLKTFHGNTDLLWAFFYESGERILAAGSCTETIQLWDLSTESSVKILRNPRLYEGMKIARVTGLTESTIANLKALGAVESKNIAF